MGMVTRQTPRTRGQATGVEGNITDGAVKPIADQGCPSKKLGKERRSGRRCKAELSDNAGGAEEEEDEVQFSIGFGNQLAELAESERVFPPPTSQVASLNREMKALETRYFRTRLNLEKVAEKNDQLRRDMKKAVAHNAKQQREISKLRHLIDRIQSERKQLEQQAINNRDYAKKIEHRFFMGTKGQSLAQCNLELSTRLYSLEDTLKTRDEGLEKCQQERDEAKDKLCIVQRALETRLETYQLNGCLHTGLLFEISKLQDHGEALALQLAQERKRVLVLETQLKTCQKHEEELEDARTVRETWVATLEKERAALDDQLAQLSGDAQTAACEKATLLRFIHEQAEARFQLEAQLKNEQAQRQQESERAQHASQLWEDERQQFKSSLQTARLETERQRDECERVQVALREQKGINAAQRARKAEMRLELEQLESARKKCEGDFVAAKDVCHELQATVEQHEGSGRKLRSEISALEATRQELLRQVEMKQSEGRALREAMEGALQDLAALSKQRNDAAKAMSEAVTISASSLEEQQALERQVEAQHTQIEKLKSAKNLLQNAMLEQLTALRKQLHVERRHRIEVEARLKHMKPKAASSRCFSSAIPMTGGIGADWDPPQPFPSAPFPSPAPFPPHLSTSSLSQRSESELPSGLSSPSSSPASYSDDEDISKALEDEFSPAKSTSASTAPVTPLLIHDNEKMNISLLELAGDMEE